MKKFIYLVAILVFTIAIFFYFRNIFLTEEGKIKKIISKGEKAIEKKDIISCLSFISPDYLDSFGNDRRSLIFLTEKVFAEYKNIFIHIESLSIEVEEKLARAKFIAKVIVTTTDNKEKNLAVEKGSERFLVTFRKEEGNWRVFRAEIPAYRFD